MIKKGFILLMLLLLCLLYVTPAFAANTVIHASCPSAGDGAVVQMRQVNDKCVLYLPGNWDATQIVLSSAKLKEVTIGSTVLPCDEPVDLTSFMGSKYELRRGNKKGKIGTLTIMQGSQITTLHLQMKASQLSQTSHDKNVIAKGGSVICVDADGAVSYSGDLDTFQGRGNSTFMYSKKPFQFKLSKKAPLGGMDKNKTWILLANWSDLALLRNQVMLDMCKQLGLRFAVDCRPVDLWLNGTYNGMYLLCEKVQIKKGRVDITDLEDATEAVNPDPVSSFRKCDLVLSGSRTPQSASAYSIPYDPDDITGGYIIEMEKSHRFNGVKGTNGFRTHSGIPFIVKEPTYCTANQMDYISTFVNDIQLAIRADSGVSPVTGRHYTDMIDVQSFVQKYLLEEFCKNFDSAGSSQFFYKDSDLVDGKLYAGPCWDYDLCFGNANVGFYHGSLPTLDHLTDKPSKANLYWLLWNHAEFADQVKHGWYADMAPLVRILLGDEAPPEGCIIHSLDQYEEELSASIAMNFTRWPEKTIRNYYEGSGTTHAASFNYMKEWIRTRYDWMNENWAE